ncbi:hypothetical protein OUZ56_007501 [Daphnia magna]|uniref:Uncharacterized protein n=1 Tax=Daphnia magna TaxID=35525 RepID=A0ABR0AAH7_9CRUS|nr:hypothetical protein OUZ56_007501 [Daphnia magna]
MLLKKPKQHIWRWLSLSCLQQGSNRLSYAEISLAIRNWNGNSKSMNSLRWIASTSFSRSILYDILHLKRVDCSLLLWVGWGHRNLAT